MEHIKFSDPLAFNRDYPAPRIPVLPVRTPLPGLGSSRSLPTGGNKVLHAPRARVALAMVASTLLKSGDKVLLPAYHCPAMIEPFIWAGCEPVFFPLEPNLTPRSDELQALLTDARAIVITRYFGFTLNTDEVAMLARSKGCLVIEDLAHAFFCEELYGHIGVTSLPKFLPAHYGSELFITNEIDSAELARQLTQSKTRSLQWHLRKVARKVKRRIPGYQGENKNVYRYFDPDNLDEPVSENHLRRASAGSDLSRERRLRNYLYLYGALKESSLGRPLYGTPGQGEVPYVFPFLLNNGIDFHTIRRGGVPLYRWEEMVSSECTVSASYRERLIQIPCHQDLEPQDLELVINVITAAE